MSHKVSAQDVALYRWISFQVYRQRRRKGLTSLALARKAGVHRNTVSRLEGGDRISVAVLYRLALALEVRVDDLVPVSPPLVQVTSSYVKSACADGKLF